ncbi:uncharacterized protein LOC106662598 [Cimex lectularius]|uniref:SAM domain-containing protein n=1 Tax=Cimex lectularius TaxID=79782 RepID=A0A8I6SEX1_CIMLE|nr:uncharacterized protein LOC106662598 [Cimex lectularius]
MTTVEGGVKSERLSPSSSGGPACDTGSSRSGTPSSSCTPPRQGGSPSQALPISRNYSDFMRSLAAKYNNNNSSPNDFLSGRNGFSSLKPGTSPPFPGLLPPPSASPATEKDVKSEGQGMLSFLPVPPVLPPVIDLNATQALLNMVRTHQQGHQLESYLKGATKRDAGNTPLDLSASAKPPKKQKRSLSESLYGADVLPLLRASKRGAGASIGQARKLAAKAACASACQEKPCTPDSQTVSHWSVEDVAGFVASVEMCAEYAQNFRDQRIDGSALALLTEEHLTTTLSMKLGPALKLRSILSSKLGQCPLCMHCTHCHTSGEK